VRRVRREDLPGDAGAGSADRSAAHEGRLMPTFPQRCTDERPHGPHQVRPRRCSWTPFQCAGRPTEAERDRQLDLAFGPQNP
jgi:hypothetical protein